MTLQQHTRQWHRCGHPMEVDFAKAQGVMQSPVEREQTHLLDTDDLDVCYERCITTNECTAFTYHNDEPGKDCNLYRGGPYTKGSGRENAKCYIMRKGNFFI